MPQTNHENIACSQHNTFAMTATGDQVVQSLLLGIALLSSIVAGANLNGASLPRATYQPASQAFGIWGLIYMSLLATTWSIATAQSVQSWSVVGSLALSLAAATAWELSVTANPKLSAFFIVLSFIASAFCVIHASFDMRTLSGWVAGLGPSLLCGWLGVAVGLGIGLPVLRNGQPELPPWVLLPGALVAAGVGVAGRAPATPAVLLWAAAFASDAPTLLRAFLVILGVLGSWWAVMRL